MDSAWDGQQKHVIAPMAPGIYCSAVERLPCIFVLHHFQDYTLSEYVGGRGAPIAVISHGVIIVDAQRFEVLDKAAL